MAFLLASFRIHDPRVLQILLDRLEYDAGDGALCLGLYGDPAAKPALENCWRRLDAEETSSYARMCWTPYSNSAARSMKRVFAQYDIWADYPEKAGPAMEALTEVERVSLLDAPDAEYRAAAAASWVNRDLDENVLKKLLDARGRDEDAFVRAKAGRRLGRRSMTTRFARNCWRS